MISGNPWSPFSVDVVLTGDRVCIFLVLQFVLLAVTYIPARAAMVLSGSVFSSVTWLGAITLLVTATAEVLTSFTMLTFSQVHPVSWPLLIAHLWLLIWLARRALRKVPV